MKNIIIILGIIMIFTNACRHGGMTAQEKFFQAKAPLTLVKKIEALKKEFNVPGVSIAIINDSASLMGIQLGFANIEKKIPVYDNTLFQACSLTKSLSSTLVVKLLQERNISLDSPVNLFLKRWQVPKSSYSKEPTIRMLLNHTAGISDPYPDGGSLYVQNKATLIEHFLGRSPAVNPPLTIISEPGSSYRYCNGCYAILQMLAEDLTGVDYRSIVEQKILKPLYMLDSTFDDKLLEQPRDNIALNYNDELKPYPLLRKMPIYSTGSLTTTALDMAKFVKAIGQALQNQPSIVTRKEALALVKPDSTPTRSLGFFIGNKYGDEEKDGKYFFHAGQNVGYLAMLIGSLDGKVGAVLLINVSSPWGAKDFPHFGFIKAALKEIAAQYHWQ